MKDTFVPKGIVFESDVHKKKSGHWNLTKWLKDTFTKRLKIAWVDECCGTNNGIPLKAELEGEGSVVLYYYSVADGDWVAVPGASFYTPTGFTGTIEGVDGDFEFEDGVLVSFTAAP